MKEEWGTLADYERVGVESGGEEGGPGLDVGEVAVVDEEGVEQVSMLASEHQSLAQTRKTHMANSASTSGSVINDLPNTSGFTESQASKALPPLSSDNVTRPSIAMASPAASTGLEPVFLYSVAT